MRIMIDYHTMLDDLWTRIATDWAYIAGAVGLLPVAVIGFAIVLLLLQRGRVGALRERILQRDDQFAELQRKLKASSSSDVLIKIGELTSKLAALSAEKTDREAAERLDPRGEQPKPFAPTIVEGTDTIEDQLSERFDSLDSDLAAAVAGSFSDRGTRRRVG